MSKPNLASLATVESMTPLVQEKQVNLLTSEDSLKRKKPPSWNLCQVAIRMTRKERKNLQRIALDSDMTIQDLLTEAISEYKEKRGLR